MDIAIALDFIAHNHRAVLATSRADGYPQLSLVATTVDDDDKVVISTRETAMKAKNLRRRPRASLIVFTDNFYGNSVQVEGPVEVVSLPKAMDGLEAYYRSISGEHPDWNDYRSAMQREQRVLVRITVERAGPDTAG
jgi:PPOX class probable F420-dependent enzyme